MSSLARKIAFFIGLNIWGFGLIFAAAALLSPTPIVWAIPVIFLGAGTLLLSSALVPNQPREAEEVEALD